MANDLNNEQHDRIVEEEEILEEEYEEEEIIEEDDGGSLEDMLQEKLERIAVLERLKQVQDEQLELIQHRLNENEIKHKEEVYWLQLELDNARREKEASEERMAELYTDLQEMVKAQKQDNKATSSSGTLTDPTAAKLLRDLEEKVEKYERTLGIMDNQISMVKTSCDEVVKTLKEEIADLMEDRCRMEIDLLNQLAALDNEKRQNQIDFMQQLKVKTETIQRLRNKDSSSGGARTVDLTDFEELEVEIAQLKLAKKRAEDILQRERTEADETIQNLEEANSKLEQKLEAAADDLAILRSGPNSEDTVKALDKIASEREEIVSTLERVATIWERADASIQSLEDAMDRMRPQDEMEIKGDRERLLSTLESASLVHGQIKVSLLLVELKLRNQLNSLKNDKLAMSWAAPSDQEVTRQMQRVQKEAFAALGQIEGALTQQIRQIEERALEETRSMKEALQQRADTLRSMQTEHKRLEDEIAKIKLSPTNHSNFVNIHQNVSEEEAPSPEKQEAGISRGALTQLEAEVFRIVERIQLKNSTIKALRADLEEFIVREQILKKELKRAMRRKGDEGNVTIKITKKTTSPVLTPTKSPLKQKIVLRQSAGNIVAPSEIVLSPAKSPLKTPVKSIPPIQPSPRELAKSRASLPFIAGANSPSKSSGVASN